ncbi:MAG: PD-(D/E)XK nuclease family protein, partial [Elusimicrobia bacterium]|nr:PD-(D/E)XK nuclease family protein [Elusimicrobiota bacterium]
LAVAKKVFDSRMKNHDTGYEYLIKRQVEKRLLDVLEYHRTNLSGIRILSCETVLRAEIKTSFGNAKLKGRADRIDRRSGAIHILDYKTGSSAGIPDWRKFDLDSRKDWPKTLKSVQMPFYVLAYTLENEQVKPADIDASLMLLGKEEIQERNLFFPARGLVRRSLGEGGKPADKSGIFSRYKKAVSILIEEILNPGLSFEPASDETVCEGCLFKTMCGRQWINSKG